MMRAADLQGQSVRTEQGEVLGCVDEIHVRDGEVIALTCGAAGLWQRFLPSRRGRRVAWRDVRAVRPGEIVVRRPGC